MYVCKIIADEATNIEEEEGIIKEAKNISKAKKIAKQHF